uniref:transposase zinc-binding domain-containing protein n=1 Tax=Paenibacillus marchantiophytorum TaxID=1619310 RepID=UPI001E5C5B0E|nr:transposase zinc-binding domain-containing protein [Paenibacillus marchantiophytorum]
MLKEIQKFRVCGDPKKGFKLLACVGCHDLKVVPFWCKGVFLHDVFMRRNGRVELCLV